MVAFTICSNNYLAHAKTLGDSFIKYHPGIKFIIGLVDEYDNNIDYTDFSAFDIILVKELAIPAFDELVKKYTITELNTAVKPAYFHFIFNKYKAAKVIYIDPDILVTSKFEEVLELLDEKNIVLTPHITKPVDDEFAPTDFHTLRGGVFNLGFLGLSNYESVKDFLDWWHERVIKYGFSDHAINMFYDQLWINYVPTFYDNYAILKHPGYNVANWNLHERYLSGDVNSGFMVNEKFPLRFFHFSGYYFDKPEVIGKYLTRYDFNSRPDLKPIFNFYRQLLINNKAESLKKAFVYYFPLLGKNNAPVVAKKKPLIVRAIKRIKRSASVLIKGR